MAREHGAVALVGHGMLNTLIGRARAVLAGPVLDRHAHIGEALLCRRVRRDTLLNESRKWAS